MSQPIPTDPVQALLAQTSLERSLFESNSRYYGLEPLQLSGKSEIVVYLPRRFLPPASRFQTLQEHTVAAGERLDHIAGQYLGDPTLFWRLCDANNALRPEALTETPGAVLRITLPDGISGSEL